MGAFTQILADYGVNVTWQQRNGDGSFTGKGTVKAIVLPLRVDEIMTEAGYSTADYQTCYTDQTLAHLDRLTIEGVIYECMPVQEMSNSALGEAYFFCTLRRFRT